MRKLCLLFLGVEIVVCHLHGIKLLKAEKEEVTEADNSFDVSGSFYYFPCSVQD